MTSERSMEDSYISNRSHRSRSNLNDSVDPSRQKRSNTFISKRGHYASNYATTVKSNENKYGTAIKFKENDNAHFDSYPSNSS